MWGMKIKECNKANLNPLRFVFYTCLHWNTVKWEHFGAVYLLNLFACLTTRSAADIMNVDV